jgi:predicted nucleotide-binding protein
MRKLAEEKTDPQALPVSDRTGRTRKRIYFSQADFPQTTLQEAQRIASALVDNFASGSATPPDIALAIGISPTSSAWRSLTGSSIAYGLTEGGFNAATIALTRLGKKLVAPEAEGADVAARREAILRPRILKEFLEKYRRAKFPSDTIATNVIKTLGVPPQRAPQALEILKANGKYAGIIRDTPTGPFVNLDSPSVPLPATTPLESRAEDKESGEEVLASSESSAGESEATPARPIATTSSDRRADRVFISHGKQKAIVEQIKELLAFGHFEPIVSVERESTAIPVPEKVFEDMRSCGAGVIHVTAETRLLDGQGTEHVRINDNVLIEIGAATALYGKKVILLVQKGVPLPSNLQGLYRCDYEGERLDYEATMKLLKTFSQFR